MAAVNYLASVSDVVVDDIAFFGLPTDGTSAVSANASAARNNNANPIRAYVNAAGNHALRHYESSFSAGVDGAALSGYPGALHRFQPLSGTSDALALGSWQSNPVFLAPGQQASIFLTWDDTYGAATSDFDIWVAQNSNSQVVCCVTNHNNDSSTGGSGIPMELTAFTNTSGGGLWYDVYIQNYNNVGPSHNVELVMTAGGVPLANDAVFNFNTLAGSVPANSDAGGGVITVGAINSTDSGANSIAGYSSRGPTGDGRTKPDVTAIDAVNVSGAAGFPSTFFGTSAAAPHVAGLTALLLEFRPDLKSGEAGDDPAADRTALRDAIMNGAIDLGDPGQDNVFGAGRADGPGAAALLFATPLFDTPTPLTLVEGATRTVDGLTFTDLNPTDTHTIAVDWGDGGTTPSAPAQAQTNAIEGVTTAVYDPTVFDIQSQGTIYTVNTTADTDDGTCDGTHCTLREAIHAANASSGTDSIHFNIAGAGPHTIWVDSALPIITGAVVVDGYTQTGTSPNKNTLAQGLNTSIKIAVRPSVSGVIGLDIQSSNPSVIRGLALQRFDKAISLTSGDSHVVEGNLLGSTADGTAGLGNNYGVWVQSGATNATVGGSTAQSANLIASSEAHAIFIDSASGATIENNLIGRDITNSTALATIGLGIYLWEGSGAVVTGNTIHSSGNHGMQVETWATANISGNTITSSARDGIFVAEGSTNINIAANTISGNNEGGIRIGDAATDSVSILGNSIFGNTRLGIDLQPATPVETEPNDALDADTGPNRLQNYPIITSSDGSSVSGTINTEASSVVRIELFTNSACHASGFGEGQTFVGVATVTTDASGNASFAIPYSAATGTVLTSTATLALSTSHFSACFTIPTPPHYADDGVFTATATVTDDEGLTDVVTFTVNVSNASPTADAGTTLNVVEGTTLTHVGSFTDPGTADTHTVSVDWGDATSSGAALNQGAGTTSATRAYDDNGSFTLTLTITDDDGGIGTDTTTVTVLNATPVVGAGPTQIVRASTELTSILIATFTDGGVLDTHTSTIDWGDGTPVASGTLDQGAGTVRGTHTYAAEGLYTVTATVTDNDGGVSIPVTMLVIVQDAPIVDAGADVTIDEGSALLFSFSFIDSASETHDATVDWGDGDSDVATVNQSAHTVSASHSYVEQGVFVLQASVSDDTGLSGLDTITVTVENVAPIVTPAGGLIATDLLVTTHALATFTDPGSADTHTAVIDWGDGTVEAGTISDGTVSGSHLLVRVGLHLITVTVTDDDGAVTEAVVNISVFNPPPVPTITGWGLALTSALMAIVFFVSIRQRSRSQARAN